MHGTQKLNHRHFQPLRRGYTKAISKSYRVLFYLIARDVVPYREDHLLASILALVRPSNSFCGHSFSKKAG